MWTYYNVYGSYDGNEIIMSHVVFINLHFTLYYILRSSDWRMSKYNI